MIFGYARISRADHQDATLQENALREAGVDRIFTDHASGAKERRPQLDELLDRLRPGDTVIVWKLDRLSRSAQHGIQLLIRLAEQGVAVKTVTGTPVDTSTAFGKAMAHMGLVWAELERDTIRERTMAGLAVARGRGKRGGRPRAMDAAKATVARQMFDSDHQIAEIARTLGVSRATVYRSLESSAGQVIRLRPDELGA